MGSVGSLQSVRQSVAGGASCGRQSVVEVAADVGAAAVAIVVAVKIEDLSATRVACRTRPPQPPRAPPC